MTRTWQENEEIVEQFRRWLSETDREAADLPDDLPDDEVDHDEPDAAQAAWESEAADFSLERNAYADEMAGDCAAADSPDPSDDDEPLPSVGLLDVVESLTAMRHELKLQTKGSRGLESAVEQARGGLDAAIREFQTVRAREQEAAARAALPLLETLVGLHEALSRGAKAFLTAQSQLPQSLTRRLHDALDQQFHDAAAWRRWPLAAWFGAARRRSGEELTAAAAEEFAKLLEGYELIVRRLERDLAEHGIRRIETVGRRVDPQLMTVVELVDDPRREAETVVEELRPGYLRGDKPIRFAEVRAVAARRAERITPDENQETIHGEQAKTERNSLRDDCAER